MTSNEARKIFDHAIAKQADPDRRAELELCREYFTTPEFRSALAQHIFEQLSGTH